MLVNSENGEEGGREVKLYHDAWGAVGEKAWEALEPTVELIYISNNRR